MNTPLAKAQTLNLSLPNHKQATTMASAEAPAPAAPATTAPTPRQRMVRHALTRRAFAMLACVVIHLSLLVILLRLNAAPTAAPDAVIPTVSIQLQPPEPERPQAKRSPLEQPEEAPPEPALPELPMLPTPSVPLPPNIPEPVALDITPIEMAIPTQTVRTVYQTTTTTTVTTTSQPVATPTPAAPPPAPAVSRAPVTPSAGDVERPPTSRHTPSPKYPQELRRKGIEGAVTVKFLINAQGNIDDVQVLNTQGSPILAQTVVDTVSRWTFSPAIHQDRATAVWATKTFRFLLEDPR